MANLSQPHVAIHLGIAAARDVEDIARCGLLLDLYFHGVSELPERLAINESLHRRLAADLRGKLLGLLNRRAANRICDRLFCNLDAVARHQRIVDVLQDGSLDPPALDHRNWIGCRFGHSGPPFDWSMSTFRSSECEALPPPAAKPVFHLYLD